MRRVKDVLEPSDAVANENGYRDANGRLIGQSAAWNKSRLASFDGDGRRLKPVLCPGDRVTLTSWAASVRNRRAEDVGRVWTIRECGCLACRSGLIVCTDQPASDGGYRHISRSVLEVVASSIRRVQ
jgi:hypothetical protein